MSTATYLNRILEPVTTARLLQMNAPQRVELREEWLAGGKDYS